MLEDPDPNLTIHEEVVPFGPRHVLDREPHPFELRSDGESSGLVFGLAIHADWATNPLHSSACHPPRPRGSPCNFV